MKIALLLSVIFLLASSAFAAPKVTEIRLQDVPGFVRGPRIHNEFVFRADGNFYWLEGTDAKPVRHQYPLDGEDFGKLVSTLAAYHFFDLGPRYPTNNIIRDASKVVVSATAGGEEKSVVDNAGAGSRPPELWVIEMMLRGFASQFTGLKRGPTT